jgi:phospholipid-transporting ATPase
LCLAWKELHPKELHEWLRLYHNASLVTKDREKATEEAADLIERDLTLIGVTGIYDQLADGVPETIGTLLEANIKIWVLTGDKQETAINVAKSCKLIQNQQVIILAASNVIEATSALETVQKNNEVV